MFLLDWEISIRCGEACVAGLLATCSCKNGQNITVWQQNLLHNWVLLVTVKHLCSNFLRQ